MSFTVFDAAKIIIIIQMAKKTDDFSLIKADIEAGRYKPVYLLHGEESYYIDQLTDLLLDRVLTDEEKDFNLSQYYGSDCEDLTEVISACRRYPMMAERQLVLLREVQAINKQRIKLDELCLYLDHPLESTIFVITCKTQALTGATKLIKACKEQGIVYLSEKIREWNLPEVINKMLQGKGLQADGRVIDMLCNSIGADLSRIQTEIDKLIISLQGRTQITVDDISRHIGVSREFNVWELQSAIAARDAFKVEMIRRYFERNPKSGPSQMVISTLFGFFSNLMLAHYSPDKSQKGLMSTVGCSFPAAKDLTTALKIYNGWKTMQNISILREFDARSKGGRGGSTPDPELLKELFYQLMH